jgi:hypothetical protein
MARRGRRSGVRFIENDRDRSLTFFKRRAGLYKAGADLSTITGARVAIVLESKNGRFSSFGAPATDPIVDAFLSGKHPTGHPDEEQRAIITKLQNKVFYVEKGLVVEDKRKEKSIRQVKELQESSWVAKFAFGKVEDLGVGEVHEMCRVLSHLHQEIQLILPTRYHGGQQEVGGLRDPSLLQPAWWYSVPSQTPPPSTLPWTPMQVPTAQLLPRFSSNTNKITFHHCEPDDAPTATTSTKIVGFFHGVTTSTKDVSVETRYPQ